MVHRLILVGTVRELRRSKESFIVIAAASPAVSGRTLKFDAAPREYLTFRVGREEYGMDILRVQEIRRYAEPVRIAHASPLFRGVSDLRGVVVPIVDLRLKFGQTDPRYDDETVTVILNVASRVIGVIVDAVSDVVTLTNEQMRPVPEFSAAVDGDYLLAIGSIADRMLILIDIERLVSGADMGLFGEHAPTTLVQ